MYKQKINTDFAISIIVILAVFFAGIFWLIGMRNTQQDPRFIVPPVGSQPPSEPNPIIGCTQEAKLCPDGVTGVGRTGPNCEFAACPSDKPKSGIQQQEPRFIVPPVGSQPPSEPNPIGGCTQEAKQCPDGVTYVGRTGPNCEFAACPKTRKK